MRCRDLVTRGGVVSVKSAAITCGTEDAMKARMVKVERSPRFISLPYSTLLPLPISRQCPIKP